MQAQETSSNIEVSSIFTIYSEQTSFSTIRNGAFFTIWENGLCDPDKSQHPIIFVKLTAATCADIEVNSGSSNIRDMLANFEEITKGYLVYPVHLRYQV